MKRFSLFVTISILCFSCAVTKITPEAVDLITKKVEGKDYTIEVTLANPTRGKTRPLTPGYELRIKADSAYAHLPYFGVAQWAPYGNTDGGIKFAKPMEGYTATPNKKGNGWDVNFKVKTTGYDYEISATIFNNNSASFSVSSTNRDMITFTGNVKR